MENRIMCPIINTEIDESECFNMHMVSEGMAPERTARKDIICVEDCKGICLKCKNHKE